MDLIQKKEVVEQSAVYTMIFIQNDYFCKNINYEFTK